MRDLVKNKQTIYYALYSGKTDIRDGNGFITGEFTLGYGTPTSMEINISPGRGGSDYELFGANTSYDHTMTTTDIDCPITENTIVWYDKSPYDSNNNLTPHNYIVVKKAKSLNSITYALRGVDVSV